MKEELEKNDPKKVKKEVPVTHQTTTVPEEENDESTKPKPRP